MKKFWILFFITAFLISGILLYGNFNTKTVIVSGIPVKEEDLILNVETSGIIEENGFEKIFVPEGDFASNILVKEGQKVEKDEEIVQLFSGSVLKSPVDGYVKMINISPISGTTLNSPLIIISNNSSLILKLSIDERDIYKIEKGNDAEITCVAVPGRVYSGKVIEIADFAKPQAGLKESGAFVDVTVEFTGDTTGIRAGYTASANIVGIKNENAITVPFDSIIKSNNENFVWVAKDNTVIKQKVETGIETDFETQILSGLEKGDIVITNPSWNFDSKIIVK